MAETLRVAPGVRVPALVLPEAAASFDTLPELTKSAPKYPGHTGKLRM